MKPPVREELPPDPIAALLALANGQYGSARKLRKPSETARRLKRGSFRKSKRPVRHDER